MVTNATIARYIIVILGLSKTAFFIINGLVTNLPYISFSSLFSSLLLLIFIQVLPFLLFWFVSKGRDIFQVLFLGIPLVFIDFYLGYQTYIACNDPQCGVGIIYIFGLEMGVILLGSTMLFIGKKFSGTNQKK